MDAQNNKKKLLWALIIGVLAIIIGIVLVITGGNKQQPAQQPTETEGPGTVVIDNTDKLQQVLLRKQYVAVSDELVSYIQTKIDPEIEHAYVVGMPVINNDGSITFTVKTESPEKEFSVHLDRNTYFDKVIFSVPSENYQVNLQIYGDHEEDE